LGIDEIVLDRVCRTHDLGVFKPCNAVDECMLHILRSEEEIPFRYISSVPHPLVRQISGGVHGLEPDHLVPIEGISRSLADDLSAVQRGTMDVLPDDRCVLSLVQVIAGESRPIDAVIVETKGIIVSSRPDFHSVKVQAER
jgi:hypothetical protein